MGVGKQLKHSENGYALLYALGATVLAILIIGGIFLLARNTYSQIEMVDRLDQLKDVEEFALQEASQELKKALDKEITYDRLGSSGLGKNISKFDTLVSKVATDYATKLKSKDVGKRGRFSYQITVSKKSVEKIDPYVYDPDSSESGWSVGSPPAASDKIINGRAMFVVKAQIQEKDGATVIKSKEASSEYVYELQWEEKDLGQSAMEVDIWRNVYYDYPVPGGVEYLSTDNWMRKMQEVYAYQQEVVNRTKPFPYDVFNPGSPQKYGAVSGYLVDYVDSKPLDFWGGKPLSKSLELSGSLFLQNGVKLKGSGSQGTLSVGNMLALRNDKSTSVKGNGIKNLAIDAGTGIYVAMNGSENSRLGVSNDSEEIVTPNFLVNDTALGSDGGFYLGKGKIVVGTTSFPNSVVFREYAGNPRVKNPQDKYWNRFIKGGFVIAGSNVLLQPTSISASPVSISTSQTDYREIDVQNGNFMLTNAKISMADGTTSLSYYHEKEKNGVKTDTVNEPSLLELNGPNTSMKVSGYSYIDSPKRKRRPSSSEAKNPSSFDGYYNSPFWNRISLKNKSSLELGITGVEPFRLSMESGTEFTMSLLPELELFDPAFIESGFHNSTIKGKLVLQPFNNADSKKLEQLLQGKGFTIETISSRTNAKDGQVSILAPNSDRQKDATELITRQFDYTHKVKY